MNILYLGPYRTQSGWGINSREYVECIVNTDHNVACKPVYMSNEGRDVKLTNKVLEAENNVFDSRPDIIIQHALPDLYCKFENVYNIGILDTETRNISPVWVEKINLLDEVWVDTNAEGNSLKKSGVTCKITVLHASINVDEFINDPVPPFRIEQENFKLEDDDFLFYFIGENNDRKNIIALVKAFHLAFGPEDKAKLLIKTNGNILQEINERRASWRIREQYIPEICISDRMPLSGIISIHKRGNCLVMPSRGESLGYPIIEAMLFNSDVIMTNEIFSAELFPALTAKSYPVSVETKRPPLPHVYTAKEMWYEIDVFDLAEKMKKVYTERADVNHKDYIIKEFNRPTVTQKINEHFTKLSEQIN